MNENELLTVLRPLEMSLHRRAARNMPETLARLLHADFEEIGRSGRHYSRDDILDEFENTQTWPQVVSTEYRVHRIGEGVALLLYRSAHVNDEGRLHRHTLRASLWLRTASGWQMRFHQGTASDSTDWPSP